MRYYLLIGLFLLAKLVLANDGFSSVTGTGGRVHLMTKEHPTIRMEREWVRMDLYPHYYDVSATFIFTNDGPATTVTMGFPESGEGDGDGSSGVIPKKGKSAFILFTSSVDGQQVAVTRKPTELKQDNQESSYKALWVKQVTFAPAQRRTVTVNYQSYYGGGSSLGEPNPETRFVIYQFTGGNWKGTVAESQLTVVSHLVGLIGFSPEVPNPKRLTSSSYADGIWNYTWRNWQAQGDFTLTYAVIDSGYLTFEFEIPIFTPTAWKKVLFKPGQIEHQKVVPLLLLRKNTTFIQLETMVSLLTSTPAYPGDQVTIVWKRKWNEVVLKVGSHAFKWHTGKAEMDIDGISKPLPAAPFLSALDYNNERQLYVPLRVIVQYFKGAVSLNMKTRQVKVTIPKYIAKE